MLSDFVHTNPKGLGLLIDTSTENILVKIAPLLPESPEDQAAILVFPIVHNCILLILLKEVYSNKIEQYLMDKILEAIRHTLFYALHFSSPNSRLGSEKSIT